MAGAGERVDMLETVVGPPALRLRRYVDRYVGYRERLPHPLVRREVAGAFVVVVLGWGDPLDVIDPRAPERGVSRTDSFVAGTLDGHCATRTAGTGLGVQPRLVGAWGLLADSGGALGVAALAAELGWSRRHLAVRFRRETGLPPKTTARLIRFARAYATLTAPRVGDGGQPGGPIPPGSWAEVAASCGYHDQSHLIRDFREFAGTSPARLSLPGSHSSNPR